MPDYPEDLKYSSEHEWVRSGNGSTVRVGVTEYAAGLQYYDESGAANESFSDIFGTAVEFAYGVNPDYNIAQIGVITRWTPVKNLTFSAEVGAFFLDQKMAGSSVFTATAPKPTALYEFRDQSTVFLNARVQRNF